MGVRLWWIVLLCSVMANVAIAGYHHIVPLPGGQILS